jgi:ribonuclease HI
VAVRLHTDSKYVLDGVTKWLPRWKTNGWQTTEAYAKPQLFPVGG